MAPFNSDYYERVFSRPEMVNALALYLQYMKRQGWKAEATTIEEVEERNVGDHVLYHAELEQQRLYGGRVNFTDDVVLPVKEEA